MELGPGSVPLPQFTEGSQLEAAPPYMEHGACRQFRSSMGSEKRGVFPNQLDAACWFLPAGSPHCVCGSTQQQRELEPSLG